MVIPPPACSATTPWFVAGMKCGIRREALHRTAFSVAFGLILVVSADGADRRSKKAAQEAQDSAPILMSKTGGGDFWADVKELTAAANKGNRKAQAQLGEMLWRGNAQHKVVQDRVRALQLLEEAARAGEPSAAFRIGMLLDDGDGLAQDRTRAMAYFRAAAAAGASEAYHNIGAAYASGRGVAPDLAEALGWLILAGQHGANTSAEMALREGLESRGGGEVIASGERRAESIALELASRKPFEWLPPAIPLIPLENSATSGKSDPAAAEPARKSSPKKR